MTFLGQVIQPLEVSVFFFSPESEDNNITNLTGLLCKAFDRVPAIIKNVLIVIVFIVCEK